MKRTILGVVLLAALLCGCRHRLQSDQTQPRLVTGITADYQNGSIRLHRQYTTDEKMRAVLDYLRCIAPYGTLQGEPPASQGSLVTIVLTYSDGSTKTYDQRSDQYLREAGGRWQSINAEKGRELALLLRLMESD